jgi:hypothetical protein
MDTHKIVWIEDFKGRKVAEDRLSKLESAYSLCEEVAEASIMLEIDEVKHLVSVRNQDYLVWIQRQTPQGIPVPSPSTTS